MKVFVIKVNDLPKIYEIDANIVTWGDRKYASSKSNDLNSVYFGEIPETHFALTREDILRKASTLVKQEINDLINQYKVKLNKLQSFLVQEDYTYVSLGDKK
jgi:hypothetical protein